MTNKIEISRGLSDELAGLFTEGFLDDSMVTAIVEVVRKHESPAVERQEPVGFRYRAHGGHWEWMDESPFADGREHYKLGGEELQPLYTSPPAPVSVVLPEPMPITEGMGRLIEAYRIGEFKLEGGSPTVEAMSCASYDNHPTAMRDHDFDSYAAGYQAAMYEEAKSLLGHIACLDKVKEMNQRENES